MKTTAWLAAALGSLAVACGGSGSSPGPYGVASGARTESPSAPVASQASDLRTHLDLLLSEQVMIVAKESAAAANHEDAYAGYTALLTANANDLTQIVRTAFGDTAADRFAAAWTAQDGVLVDYGIGVVTHNDAKAAAAMSNLTGTSMPLLATDVADASGLSPDQVAQFLSQQAIDDKAFIDDAGAQKFSSFYTDLQTAYFASGRLGDALARRIAEKYGDRFPGDPTTPGVDRRVLLNLQLQENAYLLTMAADAAVASRAADVTAVNAALSANASAISPSLAGNADFSKLMAARDAAAVSYAQKGDAGSKQALQATVTQFPPEVDRSLAQAQTSALVKVIDDQRAKASSSIAVDDRAAATSMQPIADAILRGATV